jgi:hypothetical protein
MTVETVTTWEPLSTDPYYEISTTPPHGIRRAGDGHIMKFRFDKDGYKTYGLRDRSKVWRHHQLVALQWMPNPNNYPMLDHLDNNRTNNTVENLRWCDAKINNQNYSGRNGIKYEVVDVLPDDHFVIETYSDWTFENYFYSPSTDKFYYWTGVRYRVLRMLHDQSGGVHFHMRDTDNRHRSVSVRKFKREYDLV